MLTKEDFDRIRNLFQSEIVNLRDDIDAAKDSLGADVIMSKFEFKSGLREVKDSIRSLQKEIIKLQEGQKRTIEFFDKEYLTLKQRTDALEKKPV